MKPDRHSHKLGTGPFSSEFQNASELIGRKWNGPIVWALFHGQDRFSGILSVIPKLSERLLAQRLKELCQEGVVEKSYLPDSKKIATYRLTQKGLDLRQVMISISKWAHANKTGSSPMKSPNENSSTG